MLTEHAPEGVSTEIATTDPPDAGFLGDIPVPVHALGTHGRHWFAPRLLPWLRANRNRFDVAIVHGLWEYTGFAARRAFAGCVPYVIFPHGMLDPWFKRHHPFKHAKKWLYWRLSEYWNLRDARYVLFTTAAERDLAHSTFGLHRWTPAIIPLGAEAPPAAAPHLVESFLDRCPGLRTPDGGHRRFLLHLGRIHHKKGADLLLNAFAFGPDPIAARDPGLDIVMAGPMPEQGAGWARRLRAHADASSYASRIHWPGMLRGDAKWGAFTACEAFVLPSHQENFGIAVVEALAAGRPALTTHSVNISPEIAADNCGLVDEDTPAGIHRLLTRWLSLSLQERNAMSANALHSFRDRYDMRRNTAALIHLLDHPS